MSLAMYPGLLFRRHIGEPWFKLMARIGSEGSDEYPLSPADGSLPDAQATRLVADLTARRSGELFLFVNDAVLPVPRSWQWFYNPNAGTAMVTVQLPLEPPPLEVQASWSPAPQVQRTAHAAERRDVH